MHDEFDVAIAPPRQTITLSNLDLPEIEKWENGAQYSITKHFKTRQIRKTELETGEVFVELEIISDFEYEGSLAE